MTFINLFVTQKDGTKNAQISTRHVCRKKYQDLAPNEPNKNLKLELIEEKPEIFRKSKTKTNTERSQTLECHVGGSPIF